jgi:tRNA U34 5-methylaminomethyl-2-thiouridine-forming methyltransferase MnmC
MLNTMISADGSHTLFNETINDTYHSRLGAITESAHVFIKYGLQHLIAQGKTEINLLEVGLGTGLNALLTALEVGKTENEAIHIHYHAFETVPLHSEIWQKVNYPTILGEPANVIFNSIHEANWNETKSITQNFDLTKWNYAIQNANELKGQIPDFDLIYFDAFAPNKQAEMWEVPVFEVINSLCSNNARLVTYCAKAQIKRNMRSAGFKVSKAPGPPRKREMTIAEKL